MTWFTAQQVSVTNGQVIVSVVNATSDDIAIAQEAGGLIIGNNPPVEIKRTFLDGSGNKRIELRSPWPYATQTNQPAVAFPTDADLAEATRVLREVTADFSVLPNNNSVAVRTANGRLKVTNATESNDAVARGQIGTAGFATLTTSATDTTSGRVLKVGDFGLGGGTVNSNPSPFGTNQATGSYSWGVAPTGFENLGTNVSYLHIQGVSSRFARLFFPQNAVAPEVWIQSSSNAAASPLGRIYNTGNENLINATATQRFGTNNTERMRIDSNGNVGVGTNSPSFRLDIIGNAGQSCGYQLLETSSGTNKRLQVQQDASGVIFNATFSTGGNQYIFRTGNTERMRISNDGIITAPSNGSSTDTTANRLLKVGDFGLGASGSSLTAYSPLLGGTSEGVTRITPIFKNAELEGTRYVLHIRGSANSGVQLAPRATGVDFDWRGFVGGVASPWSRIYHTRNILGTVSQSGGTPTGAIIQRGSNANGEFVRFADGTMICTGHTVTTDIAVSTALAGGFRSTGLNNLLPSSFLNQEYSITLTPTTRGGVNIPFGLGHQLSGNSSSFGYQIHAVTAQTARPYSFLWQAIGRWF